MAESERIDELRRLSLQIDEHYARGDSEKGEALLRQAIELSKDVPGYCSFFLGELAGYVEKDSEKQAGLFSKALTERPGDPFLLRQKGVSLSELGREEEAIELFDQALSTCE